MFQFGHGPKSFQRLSFCLRSFLLAAFCWKVSASEGSSKFRCVWGYRLVFLLDSTRWAWADFYRQGTNFLGFRPFHFPSRPSKATITPELRSVGVFNSSPATSKYPRF